MRYYNIQDIIEITGYKKSKAYEIIRKLKKTFEKKYPDSVSMQGRIPKWYFDECMGFKTNEDLENNAGNE